MARRSKGRAVPMAVLLLAVAVLFTAVLTMPSWLSAHGGYPMSLGVRSGSGAEPLARLVLVYLREGQGMTVEFLRFESAGAMEEAVRAGKADLLVDLAPEGWSRENCGGDRGRAAEKVGAFYRERFPGSWAAPFGFVLPTSPCPPVLLAAPKVAASLRFPLLHEALERLTAGIDTGDLSRLATEGGGTARGESDAARRILAGKGLL